MSTTAFCRIVVALSGLVTGAAFAQTAILNVSYDVSRDLYKDINPAFIAHWKKQGGANITVNQSHGGSSRQSGAVIGGLEADVVTMNQSPDIDILVERGGLVASNWRTHFPHDATPYTTISVFVVRKGNPKAIKDWNDLTRTGLQVVVPNPKTSGNGRYTYLAAWGYALKKTGSEAGARDFVAKLFANVPVLDGGSRGATTTFTQRDIGDVLVAFENEAILIARELGANQFDIVYPSLSIEAAAPVAVVQKVVAKRGTEKLARAYLNFLYTPAGQEIIARHHLRPRDSEVFKKHAAKYPSIRIFTVDDTLGGWAAVMKAHFADGGIYDQMVAKK